MLVSLLGGTPLGLSEVPQGLVRWSWNDGTGP